MKSKYQSVLQGREKYWIQAVKSKAYSRSSIIPFQS